MIYLDNSATTQPCDAAVLAAQRTLTEHWFNPSALYGPAVAVQRQMETARAQVAAPLGVSARELVFTGNGTEADSLAILGAAARFRGPRRVLLFEGEHPAVRETAAQLAAMGHRVDWIGATDEGVLDINALQALLGEDVGLVSCMHVGNETGAVQPLREISQSIRSKAPQALFHVDGAQGYLRLPLRLQSEGVDLYTVSAHKVHGPKGIGALAMRPGARIAARTAGGGQEGNLRSGTENTAGIAAFGAAVQWVQAHTEAQARLQEMKAALYEALLENIQGLRVNGPPPQSRASAPHILNVSLPGIGGEIMVHALEQEGVYVGTGAACSSKKREMRPAFLAMRAPRWAADSAIRYSLGLMNTMQDVLQAAEATVRCYERYKPVRQ